MESSATAVECTDSVLWKQRSECLFWQARKCCQTFDSSNVIFTIQEKYSKPRQSPGSRKWNKAEQFCCLSRKKINKMTTENEKIPFYAYIGFLFWGWWGKWLRSCWILKGTTEEYGWHFPQCLPALELQALFLSGLDAYDWHVQDGDAKSRGCAPESAASDQPDLLLNPGGIQVGILYEWKK